MKRKHVVREIKNNVSRFEFLMLRALSSVSYVTALGKGLAFFAITRVISVRKNPEPLLGILAKLQGNFG